jgi:hypothetical protein
MAEQRTAKEVHAMLVKYFKGRRDLGLWTVFLGLVLEPPNPFEPEKRREPRKSFVLVAVLVGLPLAAVFYFNLWL